MRVIRAESMGMCFGVRDALQAASEVSDPTQVTVHGELVHNPRVIERLERAGFRQSSEAVRTCQPQTPVVLITAHGVSNVERTKLSKEGKQLIDTTCPLVRRVHEAATEMSNEGRHIVLIGKAGHVEVRGITEDLEHYDIVSSADEVRCIGKLSLGVISQTTMPLEMVRKIYDQICSLNPESDIQFVDTVCLPTKQRQQAMMELLPKVDAVVVVGGLNSNNTRRLVALCTEHGKPALHVTCADELDQQWLASFQTVGLTAGTSTLDETIDEVERAITSLSARAGSDRA